MEGSTLHLIVRQCGDEGPVEVDDLVQGQQGRVVAPHLLVPHLPSVECCHCGAGVMELCQLCYTNLGELQASCFHGSV